MTSTLRNEPASQEDVIMVERTEQVVGPDKCIGTVYLGGEIPDSPEWKLGRSRSLSNQEGLVSDTLTNSLGRYLQSQFSSIREIERIFLREDSDFYRVWTVIPDMDIDLEDRICDAQLAFMDTFPDIRLDFSLIFRKGKPESAIRPSGAYLIHPSE
jgi:hypothetical protein